MQTAMSAIAAKTKRTAICKAAGSHLNPKTLGARARGRLLTSRTHVDIFREISHRVEAAVSTVLANVA